MSEFLFREVLNEKTTRFMAENIAKNYSIDQEKFVKKVTQGLLELSFGARISFIRDELYKILPKKYSEAINIILSSLGPEISEDELTGFDGFYIMPLTSYVAKYGLSEEDYDLSMKALYEMTKRLTSENAIRPFIRKYPKKTLLKLKSWAVDPNVHVRRLVSEGSRPRLPLSSPLKEFQEDPKPVLELLELLKEDPIRYVQRSVANSLNDISKDNPEEVIRVLKEWSKIDNSGTKWLITHSLRTLLKQGNKDALVLLGYDKNPEVVIKDFKVDPEVVIGEQFSFSFELSSVKKQKLMIDYRIYYMKANGKLAGKVFKLRKFVLKKDEKKTIIKKHSFRQMSTRKHYPGEHKIELIVNGESLIVKEFKVSEL
ncbi:MAG: DNA alkylation repair protein [Candidatus Heimdallarchaeota archaeon]|nr:DNA alkylation repair protein [Candidatus Heimdallarchaeota archaeon]MCK5047843.1 DNA alkylation repair protein [Candidatus Heimdallarchaeota archaeon]